MTVSVDHEPIWLPDPDEVTAANVSRFARRLTEHGRTQLTGDYLELWRWSVDRLDEFWPAAWDYFGIRSATPYERVLSGSVMPDVEWFTGAQVSYVEHLFRGRHPERVALIDARESAQPGEGPLSRHLTWGMLREQVGALTATLRDLGVGPGDRVAELVVTKPMPSMPVSFWNDPDGSRYREAYFGTYPGVWRHGDWITITDRCSVLVHGRSDARLNRHGIRMGSSDIYHVVEQLDEIAEALVVGVERPGGDYWMPLFVVLDPGHELDDALAGTIRRAIREGASPRHVPDEIIAVPAIPHTRTGKKLEIPVKRILQGGDPSQVMEAGAVDNPDALRWFAACQTRTSIP